MSRILGEAHVSPEKPCQDGVLEDFTEDTVYTMNTKRGSFNKCARVGEKRTLLKTFVERRFTRVVIYGDIIAASLT